MPALCTRTDLLNRLNSTVYRDPDNGVVSVLQKLMGYWHGYGHEHGHGQVLVSYATSTSLAPSTIHTLPRAPSPAPGAVAVPEACSPSYAIAPSNMTFMGVA